MDIVNDYIHYARQLFRNGCFNKSFNLYVLTFEKNPETKRLFESEFRLVLSQFNNALAAAEKIQDIFTNFRRAFRIFPENANLLNDVGLFLFKFGYYDEAFCHFQKALRADCSFANAEKNINSVKNLIVERWHFRMLNDKIRNDSYRLAIHDSITATKDSVIDIGTGTGLLAFYAHECNPKSIIACDVSQAMTSIVEGIVHDMGIKNITVLNKMSTSMDLKDIGAKCSLLITEMFDAGLFGEHILQTLSHGLINLLSGNGKILPNKAEFFVVGAHCDELRLKYQLDSSIKTLLNIPMLNVHVLLYDETYDCEDVHLFKDLKYITAPQSLIKVDFNDYVDIQDKLHRREPIDVAFNAIRDGEINTVIGWFNLYLTDKITITTNPVSETRSNAWQQAIFFDILPTEMKQNETYNFQFQMNGGKLSMVFDCNRSIDRISHEVMKFLNDVEYMKMITGCIGMACVYLGQMIEICEMTIVDLCPFPIFGLQMLKRGAKSLVCYAKTVEDKAFISKVFAMNNVEPTKITILIGEEWTPDSFKNQKYHAIICNIFELCGDTDLRLKEIAQHLKDCHLVQGGLFMPANITLMCQIVDCHWLDINNRVYKENTNINKIHEYINKFQVSQNYFLNISHLDYKPLTEPTSLGIYSNDLRSGIINIPVINDGPANAVLCWYNIELMENLGEISTNRPYSFIENMAFLAYPKVSMKRGNIANVLRCIDPDGAFKLMVHVDDN